MALDHTRGAAADETTQAGLGSPTNRRLSTASASSEAVSVPFSTIKHIDSKYSLRFMLKLRGGQQEWQKEGLNSECCPRPGTSAAVCLYNGCTVGRVGRAVACEQRRVGVVRMSARICQRACLTPCPALRTLPPPPVVQRLAIRISHATSSTSVNGPAPRLPRCEQRA